MDDRERTAGLGNIVLPGSAAPDMGDVVGGAVSAPGVLESRPVRASRREARDGTGARPKTRRRKSPGASRRTHHPPDGADEGIWRALWQLYLLFSTKERGRLALLFLLMLIGSAMEVIGVGAIPTFVLLVAAPDRAQEFPIIGDLLARLSPADPRQLVMWGAVGLLAVFIVKNLYLSFLYWFKSRFVYRQQVRLGDRLFAAYVDAPYTFHLERNPAELLRNVTHEVKLIVHEVTIPTLKLIMDGIVLIAILATLMLVEPIITIGAVALLGGGSALFLGFTRAKLRSYGKKEQYYRKAMIQAVQQALSGIKDARVMGREPFLKARFLETANRTAQSRRYRKTVNDTTKPFIETVAVAGMLLISVFLVSRTTTPSVVIPTLTLFAAATVRLLPALKESVAALTGIRHSAYAVHPVYRDLRELERAPAEWTPRDKHPRLEIKTEIRLEDIHYRYPGSEKDVLRGVSMTIPFGSAVAFVGPSGAGKTTLVDIILGLLTPERGSITADGVDIFADIRAWQRNVGYVPQHIYLADDTIRRNIAFAMDDEHIDEDRVRQAVESAQLRDLVDSLPSGLDTMVGERGIRLSGGQRQRIGIARALYENPEVLIMDEATSSLDAQTENSVVKAIEQLRANRTIIVVAHRLQTVVSCDEIYFLKNGQVAGTGTYESLVEQSTEFREMARIA